MSRSLIHCHSSWSAPRRVILPCLLLCILVVVRASDDDSNTCENKDGCGDVLPQLVTAEEGGWPEELVGEPFRYGERIYCMTERAADMAPCVGMDWFTADAKSTIRRCKVRSSKKINETHLDLDCPYDEEEESFYRTQEPAKCCERFLENDISIYKSPRSGLHFASWMNPLFMVRAVQLLERDHPTASFDGSVVLLHYEFHDRIWEGKHYNIPDRVRKSKTYKTDYHNLLRPISLSLDDKFQHAKAIHKEQRRLWMQGGKGEELQQLPFPTTFLSCEDALRARTSKADTIYYVKDKGSTRGEGIQVVTRKELESMQRTNHCNTGYNIFQEAVTDLATIAGKRFDIRFYFLTYKGKVYLHQHAVLIYMDGAPGAYHDPTNPDTMFKSATRDLGENGIVVRVYSHEQPELWEGWMQAIADGLRRALPVFETVLRAHTADPNSYQIWGGDAMITSDGQAIFPEFNDWPNIHYSSKKAVTAQLVSTTEFGPVSRSDLEEYYYNFVGQAYADFYSIVLGLEDTTGVDNSMCSGRVTEVLKI